MKDTPDIDERFHENCLGYIARNAIEYEVVALWFEFARLHSLSDRFMPETNRHFVRHKQALAGIFQKGGSQFRGSVQGAKDITAGAVIKSRNFTKNFSLGSLAASGGPENQNSAIA